ncbi:hypothetical protein FOA52_016117 [Chlamydomonas sp. UWO 241]|nr:hypothetical protein FOA52_016117 [Chlamydomonas sp. UWO 241]
MAAQLALTWAGPPEQRLKVPATPMATLGSILEQACAKLKPPLDPSTCALMIHESRARPRALDLGLTWRNANVPASARLEIALKAAPLPPLPPLPAHTAQPSEPAETVAAAAAAAAGVQPSVPTEGAAAPASEPAQPHSEAGTSSASGSGAAAGGTGAAGGSGAAAPRPSKPAAPPKPPPPPTGGPWAALGCDRDVAIYTKAALDDATAAAAAASAGAATAVAGDLPDSFFELTAEDFASISSANQARRTDGEQLRTRYLREAADAKRANAYGPVPVRVHLPDGLIVQAAFHATELLSAMQELMLKLVVPKLASPAAFYLYTTPPKQVLKDLSVSFFKALLVPAAHVYMHVNTGACTDAPLLRPEAMSAVRGVLSLSEALPGQGPLVLPAEEKPAAGSSGGVGGGGSGRNGAAAVGAAAAGAGAGGSAGVGGSSGAADGSGGPGKAMRVTAGGGAPAAERPAAAGAARAASARGPYRRGGLPARVGETSLCRSHVLSIPVAAATRLIAGRGSEGQMARDGIVRGALRDASYLGSTRHVRRLFSDCYGSEETAVAAAAVRVAAAAADGVSLPVCLAMNLVRFVHDVSGRDRPAGGGVVSASFLNAKPAVGGIGVEPRRGGVLRVLFTVASDAVADTVVRSRRNLRDVDPSAAVFDVLSDREEAQHRALWPAFLAAKAAGKRAQFHRARLVVDGERVPAPAC